MILERERGILGDGGLLAKSAQLTGFSEEQAVPFNLCRERLLGKRRGTLGGKMHWTCQTGSVW